MVKSRPTHIYIDTSAFLSILLGENDSRKLLQALGKKKICTSSLLVLETERNLIRLIRSDLITEKEYFEARKGIEGEVQKMIIRDFSFDLCLTKDFPAVKTPRSLDLAHLRTALWFKKEMDLMEFVTLDKHQAECALELGFQILGV